MPRSCVRPGPGSACDPALVSAAKDCRPARASYRPRRLQTPLYLLLRNHFAEFQQVYDDRFAPRYGFWRPVVEKVVERFLACGDLRQGFARVRCGDCGEDYLLPYSCKCRGFCPSCVQRRALEFEEFLAGRILAPDTSHRHWTWTVPKIVRRQFLHNRSLLPRLCRAAWESLASALHAALGRDDVFPGGVIVPQTFGLLLNWNPHAHGIVSETCWDREGRSFDLPGLDFDALAQTVERLFAAKVLAFLVEEEALSEEMAQKIAGWRHGFNVDCRTRIVPGDESGTRRLAGYLARAPFSLERLELTPEGACYRPERPNLFLASDEVRSDYLEMIALVTQHIPQTGAKQAIYYGAYSQAWRGRLRRKGLSRPPGDEGEPGPAVPVEPEELTAFQKACRRRWAQLIKQVWNADPLLCPNCGGRMEIIAFLQDPDAIRRILEHLGRWFSDPPPQSRAPPSGPGPPDGPGPGADEPDAPEAMEWDAMDPPWQDEVPEFREGA